MAGRLDPRSVLKLWGRPRLLAALGATVLFGAVAAGATVYWRGRPDVPITAQHLEGRLAARARPPTQPPPGPGLHPLGSARRRGDGYLYVPRSITADRPVGLVVWLHGHSGVGERGIQRLIPVADRLGVLAVAATSRGPTWDLVWRKSKRFGPDVAFVDLALDHVFDRFTVDPRRIVLVGNSDGATYALGLGLANGDLFTRVVALAPEYLPAVPRLGRPPVFVAHGLTDDQHPIDQTSRRIVPQLKAAGYTVDYQELAVGHSLPPAALESALRGM